MSKIIKTSEFGYDRWFRLDNSATIYPISIATSMQSLFRIGVELNQYIDKEQLTKAIRAIMPRYPSFAVQLRSGFFRHYFDANDNLAPEAQEDNGVLLEKIDFVHNKHFLFRVSYYKKKIMIDFFHALCDGTSAIEFTKTLVHQYLVEGGETFLDTAKLRTPDQKPLAEESEDSFLTYYRKFKLFGGVISKMTGKNALHQDGKFFRKTGFGQILGTVSTTQLLALARRYNTTITVLVAAVAMLAVAKIYATTPVKHDIIAMIPVNLRKHYKSNTLLNFTSITYNPLNPNTTPCTLEAYLAVIKDSLDSQLNEDLMRDRLSFTSFMDKYWFMKILPLPIKNFFTGAGIVLSKKTKYTFILSNVGVVDMGQEYSEKINRFFFNLNISKKAPKNISLVSYNDKTVIAFTRMIVDTQLEQLFFEKLMELGLSVEVESNFREVTL